MHKFSCKLAQLPRNLIGKYFQAYNQIVISGEGFGKGSSSIERPYRFWQIIQFQPGFVSSKCLDILRGEHSPNSGPYLRLPEQSQDRSGTQSVQPARQNKRRSLVPSLDQICLQRKNIELSYKYLGNKPSRSSCTTCWIFSG